MLPSTYQDFTFALLAVICPTGLRLLHSGGSPFFGCLLILEWIESLALTMVLGLPEKRVAMWGDG